MTKTINVTGTDCFALSAKYLGDANQFYRILAQNRNVLTTGEIVDPVISGSPIAIVLPDLETPSTGGIPTQ